MKQLSGLDLFDRMEMTDQELNCETKELVEDGIISEDVNTSDIKEVINDSNGIVEVKYGNEIYKTWTVKLISPLITKFLKGIYPDSLIVRGLTDIVVFDRKTKDIIPTEIQKTPIAGNTFQHTSFEQLIRKQLEDNIENYGKCWLFFDAEYLRYLQSGSIPKNTSINMTWLVKLMKEEKLRTFIIKYDGSARELLTKDFDFLKRVSQTCSLGCEYDERILIRNKLKIKQNVLFGYNFTQEEITKFENDFDNRKDESMGSMPYFTKSDNKRCELYGNILHSINCLRSINDSMSCESEDKHKRTEAAVILGIFYQNNFDGHNKHARIQFVDKFNIAQYFPGYLKNKEMWDYCKSKQRIFTISELNGIIEGREHCLKLIKNQSKSLSDYS